MSNTFRACTGRAQSTRIARACAQAAASRPALTPARDRPQPARRVPLRATCSPSPQRAKQSLAASPASQGLAATAARQPCPGRRRPSLPRSPPAPWSFASLSAASSPSARRRHVAIATERRFAVVLIAGRLKPTSTAYIRAPELNQVLDQPPVILLELPWPAFEEGKVFFPKSGQFGRRQAPVDFVTTRASPSPISPPRTPPPSRE